MAGQFPGVRATSTLTWTTTAGAKTATIAALPGDLIVVVAGHSGVGTITITDDRTGADASDYVNIVSSVNASSANALQVSVRRKRVTQAATITVTSTPNLDTGGGLFVYAIAGVDRAPTQGAYSTGTLYPGDVVRQIAKDDNVASGTPAPTFGSAPLATSVIIAAMMDSTNGSANSAARTSPAYTEDADNGYNTPQTGIELQHIDKGETAAAITFGASAPSAFGDVAVEINTVDPNYYTHPIVVGPARKSIFAHVPVLAGTVDEWVWPTFRSTVTHSTDAIVQFKSHTTERVIADDSSGAFNDSFNLQGSGLNRSQLGQTFRVTSATHVIRVRVFLQAIGSPSDTLTLELLTGSPPPGTTSLGSANVSGSSVPGSPGGWVDFTISSSAALQTGTDYVLVLRRSTPDGTNYYVWAADNTGPYASGLAYARWTDDVTWDPLTGEDFLFTVYGNYDPWHGTDAYISSGVTTSTVTHSTNAIILKTASVSQSADAVIKKTIAVSHSTDAIIKATLSSSHSTDAIIKKTLSVSQSADAIIKKTLSVSHSTDAIVKKTSKSVYIGEVGNASEYNAASSSKVITLTRAVPAGHLLVVAMGWNTNQNDHRINNIYGATIADSKSNSWTLVQSGNGYEATFTYERAGGMIWVCRVGTALASGDTITISYTSTTCSKAIAVDEFDYTALTGYDTPTGYIDVDTSPHTEPSTFFGYSDGLDVADLVVGGPTADTFTDDSDSNGGDTWHSTALGTNGATLSANVVLHRTYKLPTSRAQQIYNPSLGTVRPWLNNIVSFLNAAAHTSDAIILKTATRTHSTDAVVLKTSAATHSTDAEIKATLSRSHSTDADIKATIAVTQSADAIISQRFAVTQSTDALIRATLSVSQSADAIIRATLSVSHSTDAVVRKTLAATHSTDAIILKAASVAQSVDAIIRKTFAVTQSTDAVVRATFAVTQSTDAVIRATLAVTQSADAVIKKTLSVAHSTDVDIKKTLASAHSTDAVVLRTATVSHSTDASILGSVSHSTDAEIEKLGAVWQNADAIIRATLSVSQSADAIILKSASVSHSTDAVVRKSASVSHSTDALIRATLSQTHSTDAIVRATLSVSQSADAVIRKTMPAVAHSTDAIVQATMPAVTQSTDVIIRKTFAVSQSTDAIIRKSLSVAHSTDAVIRATLSVTQSTDAVIRKTFAVTHNTDAVVLKSATAAHSTDAVLQSVPHAEHSTDALILATLTRTHATDAIIRQTFSATHSTDAVITQRTTLVHSTDAVVRKTTAIAHSTDALVRKTTAVVHSTDSYILVSTTLTVAHSTDAVVRATLSVSHSTDAVVRKSIARSHGTDAVVLRATARVHNTDALVRRRSSTSHSTDALISGAVTHATDAVILRTTLRHHSTDAVVSRVRTAAHSTDAFIVPRVTVQHQTDAVLFHQRYFYNEDWPEEVYVQQDRPIYIAPEETP